MSTTRTLARYYVNIICCAVDSSVAFLFVGANTEDLTHACLNFLAAAVKGRWSVWTALAIFAHRQQII